jgi:hypothetical protein
VGEDNGVKLQTEEEEAARRCCREEEDTVKGTSRTLAPYGGLIKKTGSTIKESQYE